MKILAHAKINLDLHILGKRPDGYHEISTIMQGLALADELEVNADPHDREMPDSVLLQVEGADLPADETNLAWKAAKAMLLEAEKRGKRGYGFDVRITLKKNTPMAAGLGGGSSDAAAVIVALNELLGLRLPVELLGMIGKKLGADVPFCILVNAGEEKAAHCTGIGDFIEPVPATSHPCGLVKPALDISTPEMYRAWDEMGTIFTNDFEPIAEYKYPEIKEVKAAFRESENVSLIGDKALQIQMSGSGPTFFALYPTQEAAGKAYNLLRGRFPTVLLTSTLE